MQNFLPSHSLVEEVSMGLAGCGAGIAGLINLSLVRLCGGAGGLLEPIGKNGANVPAGTTGQVGT